MQRKVCADAPRIRLFLELTYKCFDPDFNLFSHHTFSHVPVGDSKQMLLTCLHHFRTAHFKHGRGVFASDKDGHAVVDYEIISRPLLSAYRNKGLILVFIHQIEYVFQMEYVCLRRIAGMILGWEIRAGNRYTAGTYLISSCQMRNVQK